jgi:hypothetical protein
MASLWPWLAIAAMGALHGLNPVSGWLPAAAWAVRSGDRKQALRSLLPIALGHVASVALVAGAVALGGSLDHRCLQLLAGGLLLLAAAVHLRGRLHAGPAALALWSFLVATGHGAGLMLVPALLPLCLAGTAGDSSAAGPLVLAVAAVGVHTAAMLAVTGALAAAACRGFGAAAPMLRRMLRRGAARRAA